MSVENDPIGDPPATEVQDHGAGRQVEPRNGVEQQSKENPRIDLENPDLTQKLPEKLDMAKNANDLNVDIRAILDHMTKEKKKK